MTGSIRSHDRLNPNGVADGNPKPLSLPRTDLDHRINEISPSVAIRISGVRATRQRSTGWNTPDQIEHASISHEDHV
jgi:hypothetical protein